MGYEYEGRVTEPPRAAAGERRGFDGPDAGFFLTGGESFQVSSFKFQVSRFQVGGSELDGWRGSVGDRGAQER
jgi:hypothetical protein